MVGVFAEHTQKPQQSATRPPSRPQDKEKVTYTLHPYLFIRPDMAPPHLLGFTFKYIPMDTVLGFLRYEWGRFCSHKSR